MHFLLRGRGLPVSPAGTNGATLTTDGECSVPARYQLVHKFTVSFEVQRKYLFTSLFLINQEASISQF